MLKNNKKRINPESFIALVLAVAPILQHYKGIYENAGFTAIMLAAVFLFYKLFFAAKQVVETKSLTKLQKDRLLAAVPILLFLGYTAINRGFSFSRILYAGFFGLVYIAIAMDCVDLKRVLQYAFYICCAATVVLLIQYFCYYVIRFKLQVIPVKLLHAESERWVERSTSTKIGGFYRPSGFFLEPSHVFLYFFPTIAFLLFMPKINLRRQVMAMILSMGVVLSTSGMGIAVVVGLWGIYILLYSAKGNKENKPQFSNLLTKRTLIIIAVFLCALIVAYFAVDTVRNAVNRIFVNDSGSTAIAGRVRRAMNHLKKMPAKNLIFGYSNDVEVSKFDFNVSGFFGTLFKQGIVGIILSYWFYLRGLRNMHSANFWYTLVIVFVSFFAAHTHGTFYMLLFICFQMYGYETEGEPMPVLTEKFISNIKNKMRGLWQKILSWLASKWEKLKIWFNSKRGNIKK